MALGTKMAPSGNNQGHDQFSIDTYRFDILKKTQVSDPGILGPLLSCANT